MKKSLLFVAVIGALLLTGCVPVPLGPVVPTLELPAPTEAAAASATPTAADLQPTAAGAISIEALKNATYSGIYDEPITLTDGVYEGEPFVEGDASHPIVKYIDDAELYGDLDGDGVDDAVVFLLDSAGGSGTFTQVAAQLNRGGQPTDAGAVMVGDRIGVKAAALEDGQIVLDVITQGPGDVACCSTHKARQTYALQEGRLVETTPAGGDLVQVSAADLDGTGWTLLELKEGEPVGVEVTANFPNGQISGFGGCNNYTGSFTLGDENPLVMSIGPLIATRKVCDEQAASLESRYLAALQNVSHWGYVYGKLGLYYGDGQGELDRLLFAPQPETDEAGITVPPPSDDLAMLRANPWQWVSFTGATEQFDVEDPSSYRVTFNTDALAAIVADCNNALGFYQGEGGELSIEIGPTTMAACPPGSRSDQFVKYLGSAARYFFEDGNLYIDLLADGGTMVFAPADPEPIANDGASALAFQRAK